MVDIYGCVPLWFHSHPHSLLFLVGDLLTSTSLGSPQDREMHLDQQSKVSFRGHHGALLWRRTQNFGIEFRPIEVGKRGEK
jgi:hypothetical protein